MMVAEKNFGPQNFWNVLFVIDYHSNPVGKDSIFMVL